MFTNNKFAGLSTMLGLRKVVQSSKGSVNMQIS